MKLKKTIEEIKAELIQLEEDRYNDDPPEFLVEHVFDDEDSIIENFLRNYQTSSVVCSYSSEPNPEAKFIHWKLGTEALFRLLESHWFIKQDHDIYHEHWNDLGSQDWTEYEAEVYLEDDNPLFEHFKGTEYDQGGYVSFFAYIDLGMVRVKLDVEAFEAALKTEYGIDVEELTEDDYNQMGTLKRLVL